MGIRLLRLFSALLDDKHPRSGFYRRKTVKPAFAARGPSVPLPRRTPERVGLSSSEIADFLRALDDDPTLNLHNILIVKNGAVVTEAAFHEHSTKIPKSTFSACKSVVSLVIGCLTDEGKLSLGDRVEDLLAGRGGPRGRMRGMTVRDLLMMRSGMTAFAEPNAVTEEAWTAGFLRAGLSHRPGTTFYYNSLNTYMLAVIAETVTGRPFCDYAEEKIFSPLGIVDYYWEKSPEGTVIGGWGLYILPEDFAKIGLLVLHGGVYGGRRLVSERYLSDALSAGALGASDGMAFDYGYQIWVNPEKRQFVFNGMLGQNVWGFRDEDLLILNNAGNDELFQQSAYFPLVRRYFERSFPTYRLGGFFARRRLKNTLRGLRRNPCAGTLTKKEEKRLAAGGLPAPCEELRGVVLTTSDPRAASTGLLPLFWQVLENDYAKGFSSLSFDITDGKFFVTYAQTDEVYRFAVGFSDAEETLLLLHGVPYTVGVVGGFAADGKKLSLRVSFSETPCTMCMELSWRGGEYRLHQHEQPGSAFVLEEILQMKKEWAQKPLVGGLSSLLKEDFLRGKVEKILSPTLRLERKP